MKYLTGIRDKNSVKDLTENRDKNSVKDLTGNRGRKTLQSEQTDQRNENFVMRTGRMVYTV